MGNCATCEEASEFERNMEVDYSRKPKMFTSNHSQKENFNPMEDSYIS